MTSIGNRMFSFKLTLPSFFNKKPPEIYDFLFCHKPFSESAGDGRAPRFHYLPECHLRDWLHDEITKLICRFSSSSRSHEIGQRPAGRWCSSVTCCIPEESAWPATVLTWWMRNTGWRRCCFLYFCAVNSITVGWAGQSLYEGDLLCYMSCCNVGQSCAVKQGNAFESLCV